MSTPLPQPAPGVVAVAGHAQASRHHRRWDAVLTCEDPRERHPLRVRNGTQLVLAFEDCDDASLGYAVATREQVSEALAFLQEHEQGSLLVHCTHGVGRSAAMVLAHLARQDGPGHEAESVARLLSLRPESTPNHVVVHHADDLLGRSGALMAALLESEAGNPRKLQARRNRKDYAERNPEEYAKAP